MAPRRPRRTPVRADKQTVGNVGMYYVCYRLSLRGWNVMPTSRNARGIDVLIYSQDGSITHTIQVKTLSNFIPVPLGRTLAHLTAHWVIVCAGVALGEPKCFILTPTEVVELTHKGVRGKKVSYWLQPKAYNDPQYADRWDRIGSGLTTERTPAGAP
jgi:hypothetical protein